MGRYKIRVCEKCRLEFNTTGGQKYCQPCRKVVLEELRQSGYLTQTLQHEGKYRSHSEHRENTYETKYGVDK